MRRLLALTLVVLLAATACSPTDESVTTDDATTQEEVEESGESGDTEQTEASGDAAAPLSTSGDASDFASANTDGRPTIAIADGAPDVPDGLVIEDLVAGDGAAVEAGDLIEVHYVGVTLDGAEFDASWNRGNTFFVPIGVGNLIPGWDQGLLGMTVGSRRMLVIPSDLAYGSQGAGSAIGPDESLVFVVDLLQIVDTETPAIPDVSEVGSELELIDITVGDGAEVEAGDVITVNYQGNLLDGTIFDSSWQRGQPFTTPIGVGQVIPGWDEGMVGMREGGRRVLVIPSDMAYGSAGAGALIGPDTPLVFVVDLLRVQG